MSTLLRFTSSFLSATSVFLLLLGILVMPFGMASADPMDSGGLPDDQAPVGACPAGCVGCPAAPLPDGSCGVGASCSDGAGCLNCFCSEAQSCQCMN